MIIKTSMTFLDTENNFSVKSGYISGDYAVIVNGMNFYFGYKTLMGLFFNAVCDAYLKERDILDMDTDKIHRIFKYANESAKRIKLREEQRKEGAKNGLSIKK